MKKYTLLPLLLFTIIACVNSGDRKVRVHPSKVDFILEHKIRVPKQIIQNPPMLILLHGLRSNEDDLIRMGTELDKRLLVISARAPFADGNMRYKWYDYENKGAAKPIVSAPQMESSRVKLLRLIDQLSFAYNVDTAQVFIGGFSQGAMMAYNVALSAPDKIKGIAAFSGNIPDQAKSKMANKNSLSNLSAFVSHGRRDPVLPFQQALNDKKFLESMGIRTTFREYDMMHTMNRSNIIDFTTWITSLIQDPPPPPKPEENTQ